VGKAKRAHRSDATVREMVGTALCAFAHPTDFSETFAVGNHWAGG
jgi:hypothetical protein